MMLVTNLLLGLIFIMLLALFGKLSDATNYLMEINVSTSKEAKDEIAEMVKQYKSSK